MYILYIDIERGEGPGTQRGTTTCLRLHGDSGAEGRNIGQSWLLTQSLATIYIQKLWVLFVLFLFYSRTPVV